MMMMMMMMDGTKPQCVLILVIDFAVDSSQKDASDHPTVADDVSWGGVVLLTDFGRSHVLHRILTVFPLSENQQGRK